jgi:hypothetical protein
MSVFSQQILFFGFLPINKIKCSNIFLVGLESKFKNIELILDALI